MCIFIFNYFKGCNIILNNILQFISQNYQDFLGKKLSNNTNEIISKNNSNKDKEIIQLKENLQKANKIIEQQKLKINELENKLNNYNNTINNYQNIINQKNNELNNLRTQLNNTNNNMNNNVNINLNDITSVNFKSMDQNIDYSVGCLKTNTFAEIEEKLYKEYPKYRETNNTFLVNGTQVLRFKTIAENKIGNGLPVTLIVPS